MADALVVGGGLAGGALAARLASAGIDVTLIEREPGPRDKVCGEFLSAEAARYLAASGLDLHQLGAVPLHRVRLVSGARTASVDLPFTAVSLSRQVLDEAMLALASRRGAQVIRGRKVTRLTRDGQGWRARLEDGASSTAPAVFLATGKHDLFGHGRPAGRHDDLVAFKLHHRLVPEQARENDGHVELVLFDGGYAGLSPVEDGRANLCLLVSKARLARHRHRWGALREALLEESGHLRARLAGAEACAPRPLALSCIPYGHLVRGAAEPGLWRLGDQAAVIPSFSGDGMSIALHSAELAASHFLDGRSADAFQRQLADDVARPLALATALSRLLVRPGPQRLLAALAAAVPGVMSKVAFHTRVPDAALARALKAA